jgi:hypothetical protein
MKATLLVAMLLVGTTAATMLIAPNASAVCRGLANEPEDGWCVGVYQSDPPAAPYGCAGVYHSGGGVTQCIGVANSGN